MLGILTLDTAFPRIPGDLGCPETFAFPVRHHVVQGANVDDVVHRRQATLLPLFIAAGRALASEGCVGLATTCGFLARWQRELTAELPVPILTSSLLQLPLIERTLPNGKRAGIVTYSAADLTRETLEGAGAHPYTPIEGVDPTGYFARAIRIGAARLDTVRMRDETVAAARRLIGAHHDVGAVVLECANMPPYRAAVEAAVGMPVFDAAQLVEWFHAGLTGVPARYALRDLW